MAHAPNFMVDHTTGMPVTSFSPTSVPDGAGGQIDPTQDRGTSPLATTNGSPYDPGTTPPHDTQSAIYGNGNNLDAAVDQATAILDQGSALYGPDPVAPAAQVQFTPNPAAQYQPPQAAPSYAPPAPQYAPTYAQPQFNPYQPPAPPQPQVSPLQLEAMGRYTQQLENQLRGLGPVAQAMDRPDIRERIEAILTGRDAQASSPSPSPADGAPPAVASSPTAPPQPAPYSPESLVLTRQLQEVQTQLARINLDRKVAQMEQAYGPNFNPTAVVSYALANNIPDVEVAFEQMLGKQGRVILGQMHKNPQAFAATWQQSNPTLNRVPPAPQPQQYAPAPVYQQPQFVPAQPAPAYAPQAYAPAPYAPQQQYARVEPPGARSGNHLAPAPAPPQRAPGYNQGAEQAIAMLAGGARY